jgi:hypothetical protein
MTTTQEGSNYPNLAGVVAQCQITALTADEMRSTKNATATNGVAEVVWRKVNELDPLDQTEQPLHSIFLIMRMDGGNRSSVRMKASHAREI